MSEVIDPKRVITRTKLAIFVKGFLSYCTNFSYSVRNKLWAVQLQRKFSTGAVPVVGTVQKSKMLLLI